MNDAYCIILKHVTRHWLLLVLLLHGGTLPLLQIARTTARTWRWWTSRTTRRSPTERTTAKSTCTFRRRPLPWWYPARPKVSATRSSDCWILCAVAVACFPTTCDHRMVWSNGRRNTAQQQTLGGMGSRDDNVSRTYGFPRIQTRRLTTIRYGGHLRVSVSNTSVKMIIQKSHVSKTFPF